MNTIRASLNNSGIPQATSYRLLGQPLQFILEDHFRERAFCALLDRLAGHLPSKIEPYDMAEIADLLTFLTHELPLHLADEEEDLFPLLRHRCLEEDDIEGILTRLSDDHVHAGTDTAVVTDILRVLLTEGELPEVSVSAELAQYGRHAKRHMILENAIIMPMAKLRLTPDDLRKMSTAMRQRRGVAAATGNGVQPDGWRVHDA